jgi:hypothetical protein
MKDLLRQNSELRVDGIFNWTLPAFAVQLTSGRNFNVCEQAGACATVCYARNGTYLFRNVKGKHMSNLEWVLDDLIGWKIAMIDELHAKKFRPTGRERVIDIDVEWDFDEWTWGWWKHGGKAVRIHDSGDFFSDEYLLAWIDIARRTPDVLFYAYTKEVTRMRHIVVNTDMPANFKWIYSMGGKQDHLVDKDTERHADVFPTIEDIHEAGYLSQDANDLLCVLLPTTRVGIPANNISHFKKKQGSKTFADLQHDRDEQRARKLDAVN